MERAVFDSLTSNLPKNSVKNACFVAREYIRCKEKNDSDNCAVTHKEFLEACKILIAHGYITSDKDLSVDLRHCDSDCSMNTSSGFCPGEFCLGSDATELCPYFSDSYTK